MGGKGKKNKGGRSKIHGGQQKGGRKGQRQEQSEPAIVVKRKPGHLLPVPGLSNLGNTCFFNSVMQNLGQSHYFRTRLEHLLASPSYDTEIQIPGRESSGRTLSVVESVGQLTSKLFAFLTQMQTAGGGCLNPRPVFSEICKKAPRFSGYHQQDSQELLRYLLDSLHSEEITRIKRAILQSYNVGGGKKETIGMLTDSDRGDIKAYGLQAFRAKTFVYDVFGGLLMSTVKCKDCGNSTMHETFLDLSLPVAEDKSIADPVSPGGYQTRSKNKKRGDPVEPLPPRQQPVEAKLSKHQIKKREQQARKAARKFKKKEQQTTPFSHENTPSDDKLQGDDSKETIDTDEGNSPIDNDGGEDLQETVVTKFDETTSQEPGNINAGLSYDPTDSDLQPNIDSIAVEPPTLTISTVNSVVDDQPEASMEDGMSGYAANGPLPDTSKSLNGLETAVAGLQLDIPADTNDSKQTEESQGIEMNETNPEDDDTHTSLSQAVGSDSRCNSRVRDLNSLEVEFDSLQYSLKKFCTAELLTGSNKFACVVCTKLKAEEKQKQEKGPNANDEETNQTQNNISDNIEHGQEDKEPNSSELSPDIRPHSPELSEISPDLSEVSNNNCRITDDTTKDDQDDSQGGDKMEMGQQDDLDLSNKNESDQCDDGEAVEAKDEHSHTDDDNDSENPKPKEEESDIVFCEATKQLLIEKTPPLFTLHLKRFIQNGRRLRKNNRHVSFPTVLDISPYCVVDCESECDSNGQMLYSLYGIVEHSGSMQGGHYIAYVRVRTPPTPTPVIQPRPSDKASEEPHDNTSQAMPVTKDFVEPSQTENENVMENNDVCEPTQCDSNSSDPSRGSPVPTYDSDLGESKTSKQTNCILNFDLSSTKGQWYYISDSHVRTATENEVLKSQAYLLFYEKLPLV